MSKKSQHRLSRSQRKKSGKASLPASSQRQPVAQVPSVSPPDVSTSVVREPVPGPTSAVVRYPYISAEMRRIGILAGIIISILVVLALVLP